MVTSRENIKALSLSKYMKIQYLYLTASKTAGKNARLLIVNKRVPIKSFTLGRALESSSHVHPAYPAEHVQLLKRWFPL